MGIWKPDWERFLKERKKPEPVFDEVTGEELEPEEAETGKCLTRCPRHDFHCLYTYTLTSIVVWEAFPVSGFES